MEAENFSRKLSQNDTEESVITDSITGSIICNPGLGLLDFGNVICRRDYQTINHVVIISGMGSGHEPTPVGFVGKGILAAAILGKTKLALFMLHFFVILIADELVTK